MAVVRHPLLYRKPPGSRLRFSRTRVQSSPGSSTIELLSTFAESGAYPPDRALPGSPRQRSLPLACRHPPEGHQIGARKGVTPGNTILSQPYRRRVSTDRPNREGSQLAAPLEGEPDPTPAEKTLPHSYPGNRFRRERARNERDAFETGCVTGALVQIPELTQRRITHKYTPITERTAFHDTDSQRYGLYRARYGLTFRMYLTDDDIAS